MKAGELTEKEAEAMMVTFRKEAGARDKNDTEYRAIDIYMALCFWQVEKWLSESEIKALRCWI